MLSNLTRNFVGLVLWLGALVLFAGINVVLVFANYVGTKIAFELLGYEARPLYTDELAGPLFDAVAPDATLAHLYAAAVAVVVALGIFLLLKLASHIYRLFDDRRYYASQEGMEDDRRAATRLIIRDAVLASLFLIATIYALRWDLYLFKFRSIAGAMGIEDPVQATLLKNWELQLQEHGDLFAWVATNIGAWGYLAVTALACLALEYGTIRVGEYWTRLVNGIEQAFNPPEPDFYGYDADGIPVYDPNVPVAYDTDGQPLEGEVVPTEEAPPEYEPVEPPTAPTVGGDGALFDPPPEPTAEAVPEPALDEPTVAPQQNDHRDVIGGDGARVSLVDALADANRFHVDPATLDVWDRGYWERLHGTSSN